MRAWGWVRRHRWLCVVLLSVAVVGAAASVSWAIVFRTVASPVSLRDALRIYRDHSRPDGSARDHGAMETGVFSYATTGGESLNLVGVTRSFPARTSMVVTTGSDGSCSAVEWVPLVQHIETTTICSSSRRSLATTEVTSHETIAGTTTDTVIDCPPTTYLVPPIAAPGARWASTCHQVAPSENLTATGLVLGPRSIVVQGHAVATLDVRVTFAFSGVDQGTSVVETWISTDRRLIVRERETTSVVQQDVHYTERMNSLLTSLAPAG